MENEMTPLQADYCDKLSSGNIEVAVPCENALSLFELEFYSGVLAKLGLKRIKRRDHNLAYVETTIIVSEVLEGLGK
jgi:hypothetical protein